MTTADAQLATLVATVRSLKATLDRINIVESPRAWDLTEAAHKEALTELRRKLVWTLPADTGWRRVTLSDGTLAEVFSHGNGVSFAHRAAPGGEGPATIRCRNASHAQVPLKLLQEIVLADLGIAA